MEDTQRVWVSRERIKSMGYGEFPFKYHDRKRKATILKVEDNKVSYGLQAHRDDYLGETVLVLDLNIFIKVYEPYQTAMDFIWNQPLKEEPLKEYTDNDLIEILNKITSTRILG